MLNRTYITNFRYPYFRDVGNKKVHMEEILKMEYGYCHIDAYKIVITGTQKKIMVYS
jgi:hypothetical protein